MNDKSNLIAFDSVSEDQLMRAFSLVSKVISPKELIAPKLYRLHAMAMKDKGL